VRRETIKTDKNKVKKADYLPANSASWRISGGNRLRKKKN